jgi:hypothetical protein
MKFIKSTYCAVLFFLLCPALQMHAQEMPKGYKVNMELNIDEKGDVGIVITAKYNAQFWDAIKQNHGSDPSVLKNIWKKQFPKYQLTEFSFPNADMDQTIVSKFKLLGMMDVDSKGKWIAALDQKDPNITKINDNQFLLVDEATALTMKINLPSSATGTKIEKDAFGKAILTYTAPVSGGMMGNIIKYLGFLVAAGGILLFFKNRGNLNTIFVKDASHKKIDFHEARKIAEAVVINTTAKEPLKEKVKVDKINDDLESNHE